MKHLLAVSVMSGMLLSAHVTAGCPTARPGTPPALPDGSVATEAQMLEAGNAVEKYVASVEHYLACHNSGQQDVAHTGRANWAAPVTSTYLLNWSEAVSSAWEEELTAYRQRRDLFASN